MYNEYDYPLLVDSLDEVPDDEIMDLAEQAALHEFKRFRRYISKCYENLSDADMKELFKAEDKLEELIYSPILERLAYKYRSKLMESQIDELYESLSSLRDELSKSNDELNKNRDELYKAKKEMYKQRADDLLQIVKLQEMIELNTSEAETKKKNRENRENLREKVVGTLGGFGMILWFIISALFIVLPMTILEFSWWITLIAVIIVQIDVIGPLAHLGISIWAMTVAVHQKQDWVVIAFYITFGLRILTLLPSLRTIRRST